MNYEQKQSTNQEIHNIAKYVKNSNKKELQSLRESLIGFVLSKKISRKNLLRFIEQNPNTPASGLMTTFLDLTSSDFYQRQQADIIGKKEEYGFLAYKGVKMGLSLEQGRLGNFFYAWGFEGNAGQGSFYDWATGFKDNAGKQSVYIRAKEFEGTAGSYSEYEFAQDFKGFAGQNSNFQLAQNSKETSGFFSKYAQKKSFLDDAGFCSKTEIPFIFSIKESLNIIKKEVRSKSQQYFRKFKRGLKSFIEGDSEMSNISFNRYD